jgi:hypothetical protein
VLAEVPVKTLQSIYINGLPGIFQVFESAASHVASV